MSATTTARRASIVHPAGFAIAVAASALIGLAAGTALDGWATPGSPSSATEAGPGPAVMTEPASRFIVTNEPQLE